MQGALIDQVYEGGPADKAGLQPNDCVVKIQGKQVDGVAPMRLQIASMSPSEKAVMEIIRDKSPKKITVTIEEQTKEKIATMGGKRVLDFLGIEVGELSEEEAAELGVREGGVMVTQVNRGSQLARKNQAGEAIIGVNQTIVRNVPEFMRAISQSKNGLQLVIRNARSTRMLGIQMDR